MTMALKEIHHIITIEFEKFNLKKEIGRGWSSLYDSWTSTL